MALRQSVWRRGDAIGCGRSRQIGVLDFIDADQCRPFDGISWLDTHGHGIDADFASGNGLAIRRTGPSNAPFRRAQLDGIQLWQKPWSKWCLKLMVCSSPCAMKDNHELENSDCHRGRWKNSRIRKWSMLQGKPPVSIRRWGAPALLYCAVVEPRLWWANGVEAYITPIESRVEVAFLWDEASYEPPEKGAKLVTSMLSRFQHCCRCRATSMRQPVRLPPWVHWLSHRAVPLQTVFYSWAMRLAMLMASPAKGSQQACFRPKLWPRYCPDYWQKIALINGDYLASVGRLNASFTRRPKQLSF